MSAVIRFVDLHSHVLPGVDDGAESMDLALELLRQAVSQGVRAAVLTPHILPGDRPAKAELHRRRFHQLREAAGGLQIPIALHLGAELAFRPHLGEVAGWPGCTLAESRYVLVDLAAGLVPPMLEQSLFELRAAGFRPVLAHPERQSMLARQIDLIIRLQEQEVLIQVDAGSLTGTFGRHVRRAAVRLVRRGLVQLVASDAHDLRRRPFELAGAAEVLGRLIGRDRTELLLASNPAQVVDHGEIVIGLPLRRRGESGVMGLLRECCRRIGWSGAW